MTASCCTHCGLPLAERSGAEARFCCLGCEIAAAIHGADDADPGPVIARLGVGAFLSMNAMMFALPLYGVDHAGGELPAWAELLRWLSLLVSAPAVALLAVPFARSGWSTLKAGQVRAELLIVVGSVTAFAISAVNTVRDQGPVYFESATMVLLLVTLGTYLSAQARSGTRDGLRRLFAESGPGHPVQRGAQTLTLREEDIEVGDRVLLAKGSRVPVDGVVLETAGAALDRSLLTGEPGLHVTRPGQALRAGEVVREGSLRLAANSDARTGTLGRVRAALERALERPPRLYRAVDRAAQLLFAVTVLLAALVVVLQIRAGDPGEGLRRAISLMVVACPCALGLATPLALATALRRGASLGVVIQSLEGFEQLAAVDLVAADKTGTLTTGNPATLQLVARRESAEEPRIREILASLCRASRHPLAEAIAGALPCDFSEPDPSLRVEEVPGCGVRARTGSGEYWLGRPEWVMGELGNPPSPSPADSAAAFPQKSCGPLRSILADRDGVLAEIEVAEELRPGARAMSRQLRAMGLPLLLLSGDREERCRSVAEELRAEARGGLLPDQKADAIEALQESGQRVAWICDGVNDSPAMAQADVAMAVDRKVEWLADAADLVLLGNRLDRIPELVDLSRRAKRRIVGNLVWTALYNAAALGLGAAGLLSPPLAALTMVLASVGVALRSQRPYHSPASANSLPEGDSAAPSLQGA